MQPLFPRLSDPDDGEALRVGAETIAYGELAAAAAAVAASLKGVERVAVWAEPTLQACAAVLGGLAAGTAIVPVNPRAGSRDGEHIGRFSPAALADAFERGATMMFGVPTMYHRLALEAEQDAALGRAFGRARLLVSGSAPLPAVEHQRLERLTGQQIVERYGM